MDFAVILIATIVGCFALRNPLKALPVAFYAAAIAIDVVYVYGVFFGLPRAIWSPLFVLIQKCELSLALFVVVMFTTAATTAFVIVVMFMLMFMMLFVLVLT